MAEKLLGQLQVVAFPLDLVAAVCQPRCMFTPHDLLHLENPAPLGLVPQTILKRAARVLLSNEELYRLRVVKFGERVQTHRTGRFAAPRGEARASTPPPK